MAEGWIQGKPCRVTIDTGTAVTIARPDSRSTARQEAQRSLRLADGLWRDHPLLKEALVELSLGRIALRIWVFVTEVMDEFILGLGVLRAYNASVDLLRCRLRLGQEEVTVWRPGAQLKSARLSLVGDEVIPARCERMVMARLEAPLGATDVLI